MMGIALIAMNVSLIASNLQAQDDTHIHYTVDLANMRNHYITVTATIPSEGETTELMMAVWTPGSYLVREYARHIDSMEVTADGKQLDYEKTRKNRWLVNSGDAKTFRVKYRLYCNEMSVRTNWVGGEYAMLNGAPTYVTVPDRLDRAHVVELKLPRAWKRSATSLRTTGESPHTFKAESFDELVDSPIVAGNINVYPFTVGGIDHQLVNVGESGQWDGTKAATDLKRIVAEHHKMWGTIPYDRYLFLNMIVESGGGLEHDNSTVLMTSRWSFRDEGRYKSWLSLASHEFFHTWNVRRLRPKSLVKYDYENEVYTDGLWIAEGITSYYQDLALARAGFYTNSEFVSKVSRDVQNVQRTLGRKLQSLKDSSYDAWIKYYRPDENSSNTRISYYSKGSVVAFLLDAKIRKLTKGKKSLDDVMRKMFNEYAESGFTSKEFRKTASDIAGEDLTDWFASTIDSTDDLIYTDVDAIGIVVPNKEETEKPDASSDAEDEKPAKRKRRKKKNDESNKTNKKRSGNAKTTGKKSKPKIRLGTPVKGDKSEADPSNPDTKPKEAPKRPWLGFSSSGGTVSGVKPDSPASDIGLNNGDEVIGVDGYRVSSVDSRLSNYEVGDEMEILIARRGKLMTLTLTVGERQSENWRLRLESKPSKSQKKQLDAWLGNSGDSDDSSD